MDKYEYLEDKIQDIQTMLLYAKETIQKRDYIKVIKDELDILLEIQKDVINFNKSKHQLKIF